MSLVHFISFLFKCDHLFHVFLVCSDPFDAGCDGGVPIYAMYYVRVNGGIELDSEYPYTSYYGTTGTCTGNGKDNVVCTLGDQHDSRLTAMDTLFGLTTRQYSPSCDNTP